MLINPNEQGGGQGIKVGVKKKSEKDKIVKNNKLLVVKTNPRLLLIITSFSRPKD